MLSGDSLESSNAFCNAEHLTSRSIMSHSSTSRAHLQRRGAVVGLANRMKRALSLAELSDVQFAVGRECDDGEIKIFQAHKNILSLSSDVFHTMFYGSMPASTQEPIDIPDILPEAFAIMLSYVYTDSVEDFNAQNVFPTLRCADKYDLPVLMDRCCEYILHHLNTDNCLITLENANRWSPDFDSIVEKCLDLVDASDGAVFQSEPFTALSLDSLQMILQRPTLAAPEIVIYKAVEKWAAGECKRHNMDLSTANRRQMLGDALFLVRFPLLTDAELAGGPVKNELLLPPELWDIYLYKHTTEQPALPFATEPRRFVQHRIGDVVFKDKEAIFVEEYNGDGYWYPAEVIGERGGKCVGRWLHTRWEGPIAVERLIRAADVLQRGLQLRPLLWGMLVGATYCHYRGGQHVVEVDGNERFAKVEEMVLPKEVGAAWKAAHE
ncbi:BTB/POZ domain-containing protein 2-like [Paramacrobiotus metropolitanus]|uniref:BTB/POZ domain-containing protein 2-like n=1 Tax=Paramacrobiotus metropolitanus TaxID=2943436 RepID=UPI0024458C16|nr:BTB/POZ domain-containing protein 2-like [Paramacrobiotus metropolitanus]